MNDTGYKKSKERYIFESMYTVMSSLNDICKNKNASQNLTSIERETGLNLRKHPIFKDKKSV